MPYTILSQLITNKYSLHTDDYQDYTAYQSLISRAKTLIPQPKPLHRLSPKESPVSTIADCSLRQLTLEEALEHLSSALSSPFVYCDLEQAEEARIPCSKCFLPLPPDPKPGDLSIFLHALRYTTSLGSFETEMPEWTKEGCVWDCSSMPPVVNGIE